jgi:hypothetical protein
MAAFAPFPLTVAVYATNQPLRGRARRKESLDPSSCATEAAAVATETAKMRKTEPHSRPVSMAPAGGEPSSRTVSYQAASVPRV